MGRAKAQPHACGAFDACKAALPPDGTCCACHALSDHGAGRSVLPLALIMAPAQAAREERRARERAERAARGEDEDEEPVARIVAYSDRCARLAVHEAVNTLSARAPWQGRGHGQASPPRLPAREALRHAFCTTSAFACCSERGVQGQGPSHQAPARLRSLSCHRDDTSG